MGHLRVNPQKGVDACRVIPEDDTGSKTLSQLSAYKHVKTHMTYQRIGCQTRPMTTALLSFAAFSLLLTLSPGPDTLLVLRNCLRGGRRTGAATAAGAATGALVWSVAAAVGLAAALQRWGAAYEFVRYAGAAYLVFLGVQALWAQRRPGALPDPGLDAPGLDAPDPAHPTAAAPVVAVVAAFRQGLVSDLLNPKVGLFFIAVVPQFLPQGYPPLAVTLLFGLIDALIVVGWLAVVAYLATRMLSWLRRPRVNRAVERISGGALITFGVGAAAEAR